MKRNRYLIYRSLLAGIFILYATVLTSCGHAKGTVKSLALQPEYQAGKLLANDTIIKHTFLLKSVGTADLHIDSVAGSCNCVDIKWDKKLIRPGDTAYINVTVRSSPTDSGKHMQHVVVKTNATTPFTTFRIFFIR